MSKTFNLDEVASHSTEETGLWIVVDGGVYDVTSELPRLHLCFRS
jgi:cytochrome b involved in lipid metabolism